MMREFGSVGRERDSRCVHSVEANLGRCQRLTLTEGQRPQTLMRSSDDRKSEVSYVCVKAC